jgi:hypothetical protein
MAFSIVTLITITLSKIDLIVSLDIRMIGISIVIMLSDAFYYCYAKCHYAESHYLDCSSATDLVSSQTYGYFWFYIFGTNLT